MFAQLFGGGPLIWKMPQASTIAPHIDLLYDFLWWTSVALLLPVTIVMIYFAIKYRAKPGDKSDTPHIHGNHLFEWGVSTFLGAIFLAVFIWGFVGYNQLHKPPQDAYEINVIGQQWVWTFQYANGKTDPELYVPSGLPVKLIMTSKDVIHSLYIPDFRVKWDVVPGAYQSLWFTATKPGSYDIFCAEFCGVAHSNMITKIHVLEPVQFKAWLDGVDPKLVSTASSGKTIFTSRNCVACHSVDGKVSKNGPTLKGLFGSVVNLADGSKVKADENYLRVSIMSPGTHVVKGFAPIMPTYQGMMKEEELTELIAYLKSLKE